MNMIETEERIKNAFVGCEISFCYNLATRKVLMTLSYKEKDYGMVREQLTEGFKNGMNRKLDNVVKKSCN